MRSLCLLATLALFSPPSALAEEGPKWFKKKTQIQEQKAAEEAAKAAEKPIVGEPEDGLATETTDESGKTKAKAASDEPTAASDLSGKQEKKEASTLFSSRGLTDSLGLDYGTLKQPVIDGKLLSAQYGLGWWWTPKFTIGLFARAGMMLKNEYLFMMVMLGPQARYFLTKNLAITGFAGLNFTQGLSRVPTTHIPVPPSDTELRARRGLAVGGQIAWLFWPKRDLGLGPAITYWRGSSGDRSFSMVTFGFTYQSGKPNLSGSVMEDY